MNLQRRILIAVDDSEASRRAVEYVASMLGSRRGFHVCLLHMLPPFPPALLEVGGSEDPDVEAEEEAEIKDQQAAWLQQAKQAAQPMLEKALSTLRSARVPQRAIETQLATSVGEHEVVPTILEVATRDNYETIVVGRAAFSGLQKFVKHHIADTLLRQIHGRTLWVVE